MKKPRMAHHLCIAAALVMLMAAGASPAVAQVLGLHTEPTTLHAAQTFVLELTAASPAELVAISWQ